MDYHGIVTSATLGSAVDIRGIHAAEGLWSVTPERLRLYADFIARASKSAGRLAYVPVGDCYAAVEGFHDFVIAREFQQLADQWHTDTDDLSASSQIISHPAYLQIIGMGESAIPFILNDLRQRGGQWYAALRAITRESPVPPEMQGNVPWMKGAWLRWGHEHGYVLNGR